MEPFFEVWMVPRIVSYLHDSDLPNLRIINHFWNQCIVESLSFPRITYNKLNSQIIMKCKPHQHRSSKILIVGDGDFSFSLSLCTLIPSIHYCSICKIPKESRIIITSTLSPNIDALSINHPSAINNINTITTLYPFCSILYGVDATDLEHTLGVDTLFDEIIWNFPHSNNRRHIKSNRNLLSNFFKSSANYLSQNGIITVRLCFGQSGTLKEEETLKTLINNPYSKAIPLSLQLDQRYKNSKRIRLKYHNKTKIIKLRDYNNSWKIVEMASYSHFILCNVRPFYWNVFTALYYKQIGRRGSDKQFLMDLSLSLTFIKDNHRLDQNYVHKLYPLTFFRDISFWLSDEWHQYMKHNTFKDFVLTKLGNDIVFKVEYLNEFIHKETDKKSKTFRIWYKDKKYAFNRYKCNDLQSILRDALRDELNVGVANNPFQQK